MRESELHTHIYQRSSDLPSGPNTSLLVGPGDDCAIIANTNDPRTLLSVDQLIESRHFTPDTEINLIARKAIARSVSDIAAMGATPSWTLATAILPPKYQHANELFDAMHSWALHWNAPLIGGDIATHKSKDHPLTLTVTIGGTLKPDARPVLRSGAKPGDHLYLTGQVGGSFESGWHLLFEPRVEVGHWASTKDSGVHAMIDLSDGLGRDATRIAHASDVILEIESSKLPINHRCPSWKEAASEGEDYELLITIDPNAPLPTLDPPLQGPIGIVRPCNDNESPTAIILDPYGNPHDASSMGWDHE